MRKAAVWLTVSIGLLTGPSLADEAGKLIAGDAIVQALADHAVNAVTLKGKKWSAVFKSDGTVEYGSGGKGTWRVDGEKFCDHPSGDQEYCGNILSMGDSKYQWVKPGATKGTELTVE